MSDQQSQELQDQNIFDLLGVTDGNQDEREKFLDELQQVIWEDFLEYDVELLLTKDELATLRTMVDVKQPLSEQEQEDVITFLEDKVTNLEEIMLDKALQLKGDMVRERVSGMKDLYAGNEEALRKIADAEVALAEEKWADVASLLNSVK